MPMIEAREWRKLSNREILDSVEIAIQVIEGRSTKKDEARRMLYTAKRLFDIVLEILY